MGQSAEIAINPHWVKNIPYNPEKDLQPIALGVIVPLGLVVPAKAPYASLKELVDAARSSRQGLSFASAGTGTPSHFAGELLKLRTKGNLSHVPYKGAGPALNDILGGHVDLYFPGLPAALGNVRAGQMKLLAVSSADRASVVARAYRPLRKRPISPGSTSRYGSASSRPAARRPRSSNG